MNNKIYAIYARNPDGSEDMISEKFDESWVPYCSTEWKFIQSVLTRAKGVAEQHGRAAVLKTFSLTEEKIL